MTSPRHLRVDGSDGPDALERYLDRVSTLKKHVQEVLFLEMETRRPAERIQVWARVVATLLAGSLAFFLQLQLTLHASRSSELGYPKLPVLEPGARRVRFTDAPRCYRMQVRLTLKIDGRTEIEHQTVVLSKRGLERIEEMR